MKIKLIIHHMFSKRDVYGNVYWKTRYTNTRTGKQLTISTPHRSNAEGQACRAGYDNWQEIYCHEEMMLARDFKRIEVDMHDHCKDEEVTKAIKRLNRK
jgi:hypothetical protein